VWLDTRSKRDGTRVSYVIQEPNWGIDQDTGLETAARKDHNEKMSLIFNEGYEAYGYFVEAKDKNAHPREIESTKTSFIFSFDLERQEDGSVLGYPKTRIEIR